MVTSCPPFEFVHAASALCGGLLELPLNCDSLLTLTITLAMIAGISSADGATARDLFKQQDLAAVQPGGSFTATLPGYGTQAVKFKSKSRVVCDEALWYHSSAARTAPHYLRTYVQLDCAEGEQISQVRFASLGLPAGGECGGGSERVVSTGCHLPRSREIVEVRACLVSTRIMMLVYWYAVALALSVSRGATACVQFQVTRNTTCIH